MLQGRRAALAGLVLLIFAADVSDVAAQTRRELKVGVAGLPGEIDPTSALYGTVPLVARQMFDTLVRYAPSSTDIEPALATRWTVSRDGLTWSFTLRDGVRFHDGTPLTAAEVAASFAPPLAAGSSPPPPRPVWSALLRGVPGVVQEVRAADARTVQIALVQPYAALLTVLAHPGFGVVKRGTGPDGMPRLIGSGPFRVTEAGPGRLVLEAQPNHWTGGPRSERLVFLEVGSDERAEADLDAQVLDAWFPPGPPRRAEGSQSAPGPRVGYVAFQVERDPFMRKKVRQAVATGIDPAALGAALGRAAIPLQSFLPPGVWARREGSPVLGGHRQAAKKLLAEGGWPRGHKSLLAVHVPGDGILDPMRVAEVIVSNLALADIPVQARAVTQGPTPPPAPVGEAGMWLGERVVLGGDPHLFLYPLSTSEGQRRPPRPQAYSLARNATLDDVLIRASQLSFRPERQRLYHRAQAMLADDLPWIPIYVRLEWAVARPEVRGLRLHPSGIHRLDTVSLEGGGGR
jgi:peptide/nickel transport system substrate-binding protein